MTTLSRRPFAAALAVFGALILSSCAMGDTPPVPVLVEDAADVQEETQEEAPAAEGSGKVTMVMAGQSFTFSATTCLIGDDDILVMGPGADDESGEPAFLDLDLATVDNLKHGEIRVELGTDAPLTSTDQFYMTTIAPDHEYGIMYDGDGKGLVVDANYLAANGVPIGPATVTVKCD